MKSIQTKELKKVFDITTEMISLTAQKNIINAKINDLKKKKEIECEVLADKYEKGYYIASKLYTMQLKPHSTLPYINWRKIVEVEAPKVYANTMLDIERKEWNEVIVSKAAI